MIGIDTNVLVRYLVRDDAAQFEIARTLLDEASRAGRRVFVSLLVLQETEWVLRSRYKIEKARILATIAGLLESLDVQVEDPATVEQAVFAWESSAAGFSDCLIGARNQQAGCSATATFDAKATRLPWFIDATTGK